MAGTLDAIIDETFERDFIEGDDPLVELITWERLGYNASDIVDWDLRLVSITGDALEGEDFSYTHRLTDFGLEITFTALNDDEYHTSGNEALWETATFNLEGYVCYRWPFNAPDDEQELYIDQGVVTVNMNIKDQPILSFEHPGATVMIDESGPSPEFTFTLEAPYDKPIDIQIEIGGSGYENELRPLSVTIPAGVTSFTTPIFEVLNNPDELKSVKLDNVTLTASIEGKPLNFSETIEINHSDAVKAGYEDAAIIDITETIKNVQDIKFELMDLLLLAEKTDATSKIREKLSGIANKLGIAIDVVKHSAVFLTAYSESRNHTGEERYQREYDALKNLYVEVVSEAVSGIIQSGGAAGIAVGIGWATTGTLLAPAAIASLPILAVATVGGWGLSILWEATYEAQLKTHLDQEFENDVSAEIYIESRESLDETIEAIIGPQSLNDPVEGTDANELALLTDGDDQYNTGGGNDVVASGRGLDQITLMTGANRVVGSLAEHDGDVISGFGTDDQLIIHSANLSRQQMEIVIGSAIINIDENEDGATDSQITLEGDFSAGEFMAVTMGDNTHITFATYLPVLNEGAALSSENVNGIINQGFLTGDGMREFQVSLEEFARSGYDNVIGVYEIDEDGNIVDVRILFENSNADKGEMVTVSDIEDGHQLGFFIVQDAADWASALASSDQLQFTNSAGDLANLDDGDDLFLSVNGQATDETVFHSFAPSLNHDGVQHAVSGVVEGGEGIFVGFEDLTGGGDRDYQDAVIRVELVI